MECSDVDEVRNVIRSCRNMHKLSSNSGPQPSSKPDHVAREISNQSIRHINGRWCFVRQRTHAMQPETRTKTVERTDKGDEVDRQRLQLAVQEAMLGRRERTLKEREKAILDPAAQAQSGKKATGTGEKVQTKEKIDVPTGMSPKQHDGSLHVGSTTQQPGGCGELDKQTGRDRKRDSGEIHNIDEPLKKELLHKPNKPDEVKPSKAQPTNQQQGKQSQQLTKKQKKALKRQAREQERQGAQPLLPDSKPDEAKLPESEKTKHVNPCIDVDAGFEKWRDDAQESVHLSRKNGSQKAASVRAKSVEGPARPGSVVGEGDKAKSAAGSAAAAGSSTYSLHISSIAAGDSYRRDGKAPAKVAGEEETHWVAESNKGTKKNDGASNGGGGDGGGGWGDEGNKNDAAAAKADVDAVAKGTGWADVEGVEEQNKVQGNWASAAETADKGVASNIAW